jgi:hypothetical protein
MKKYLKEIEISGVLLMFIGCISYRLFNLEAGLVAAGIGLLLFILEIVYKAFNWQEYRRDNIQNIIIMLGAIVALFLVLFLKR